MSFPIPSVSPSPASGGFTFVQHKDSPPAVLKVPAVTPAPPSYATPTPGGVAPPAACTLESPNLVQVKQCTDAWRSLPRSSATTAKAQAAYRAELRVLNGLIDRAKAGRGDAAGHQEVLAFYKSHYALMTPAETWDHGFPRERQQDYTKSWNRYVDGLMRSDIRQYALEGGAGQDTRFALNRAVAELLRIRSPGDEDSAKTLAWLANVPDPALLRGFSGNPALERWLVALRRDPQLKEMPTVKAAWDGLLFDIANTRSVQLDKEVPNFEKRFSDTRSLLLRPSPRNSERKEFDDGVRKHIGELRAGWVRFASWQQGSFVGLDPDGEESKAKVRAEQAKEDAKLAIVAAAK